MKKFFMLIITVMITVSMLLNTAGCKSDENEKWPDPTGTYKLKIDAEKAPDDQKALAQTMTGMVDMTIVLTEDGKVRADVALSVMGQSSSRSTEGTWTQEKNKILITGTEQTDSGIPIKTDGEFEIREEKLFFAAQMGSGESSGETDYIYFEK